MNPLGCSIGESKGNVYDNAIVAELERNCDGLGFRLGPRFGWALRASGGTKNEDGESRCESHRKIVAG